MRASAGAIGPGFDLFQTVPFTTDLGPLGMVSLQGVPIGSGNTDTIVQRTGQPPPGYPESRIFPAGDFYPGPIPHQGQHPVEPSPPEPSTVLLLGAGITALASAQRRICRRAGSWSRMP